MVIGATNRPDSIDSALRRAGRFDREICIGVPDTAGRAKILEVMTRKMRLEGSFDFLSVAKKTPGFVGADIAALAKEAAVISINRIFKGHSLLKGTAQEGVVDAPAVGIPAGGVAADTGAASRADPAVPAAATIGEGAGEGNGAAASDASAGSSASEEATAAVTTDASEAEMKDGASGVSSNGKSGDSGKQAEPAQEANGGDNDEEKEEEEEEEGFKPLTADQLADLRITQDDFVLAIVRLQALDAWIMVVGGGTGFAQALV